MADHHTPLEVSQEAVDNARDLWNKFTKATTFAVVGTAIVLLAMAFFIA